MHCPEIRVKDGCTAFLNTVGNSLLDDTPELLFSIDAPHLQTGNLLLQFLTCLSLLNKHGLRLFQSLSYTAIPATYPEG
jgi:hypothetical protein